MQAASQLVHCPIDAEDSSAWLFQHRDYFDSPFYGSMELHDARWITYCGNDCSPRLDRVLLAPPTDAEAGAAFIELHQALTRIHEPHRSA